MLTQSERDWLTLALVPGVGTTLFIRLLARFESANAVLKASEAALREVVGPKLAQRIRTYQDVIDIEGQLRALQMYNVQFLSLDHPEYPPQLAEIYDPPLALYLRGTLVEQDQSSVAIVGTRKASSYALNMAEQLAYTLAKRGITVISGLASGVDAAAHRGALNAGGRTLAVLGCGVDVVYPPENAELMHQIIQRGGVLSSFPMGVQPSRGRFPHRNRFISGLSKGVLVIEAPPGSGALITARHAAEQGREVFALPGRVGERNSLGPHSLIREGAKLVETVEDILVELNLPATAYQPKQEAPPEAPVVLKEPSSTPSSPSPVTQSQATPPPLSDITPVEKSVLEALSQQGSFVDEIALACRISISEALSSLTLLELKGLVHQFSGKRFAPRC